MGKSTQKDLKQQTIEIFEDATFSLHKWHSNASELEEVPVLPVDKEETFAKQQLGKPNGVETSLLGLGWNKERDEISVSFPGKKADSTKRGVLRKLASIYDPLGLVSPVTLEGKLLFRAVCCEKNTWDAPLSTSLQLKWDKWDKWENHLPEQVTVARPLAEHRQPIESIQLHGFGEASGHGLGTAVYAIVKQESGLTQRLVAAKARLAKEGLTIPRLELVSAHMTTNLLVNVREALKGFPVTELYGWLDSTVALHWIKGGGQYKQFVENRRRKIQAQPEITWRHVPTEENPADLASRGGDVEHREMWWHGPEWIAHPKCWPPDPVTQPTTESRAEVKVTKELFAVAMNVTDELDGVLGKFGLSKATRVCVGLAVCAQFSPY